MWTREELKIRAKDVLRPSYWTAFVVSLVMAFLGGRGGGGFNFQSLNHKDMGDMWPIFLAIFAAVFICSLTLRIFVGYHLEVGGRRYFTQAAQGVVNMNFLGYGFKKGRYKNILKTLFKKAVLIFLWTLLLIIPGIIKAFAYRMVPYIMADNPLIDSDRAIRLSEGMTNGHKFNMWVLDLSFIGWYLLGVLACCVGVLFVMPYQDSTSAELYLVLRREALEKGICSYQELMLAPPVPETPYNTEF